MAGAYTYTPLIWPPLVSAVLVVAIGLYSWRRRHRVPAALPLAVVALFTTLWLLGIAFEAAAVAPAAKIAWFRFQSIWRAPVVTAGLCFVLEYAWPGRWLTRRNLVLLAIPALLDILLVLAGDAHLMWYQFRSGPDGQILADLAPSGVVMAVYGIGLVLVNAAVLLWLFMRSPQHRWPVAIMLVGQLGARLLYLVSAIHLPWALAVDPMVISPAVTFAAYAIALFGFRIFDPLPAARRAALDQMREGVIVFDPETRVVSVNHAAESMLGISARDALGRGPTELLLPLANLGARVPAAPPEPLEVNVPGEAGLRSLEVEVTPLYDFRGLLLGHLLLLRDVTERRRAEGQIVEQQRSLAMLAERELLARELHDGTGQVLGYASLKLGAIQQLVSDGKLARADEQIASLQRAVVEAHENVRETILNLRTGPTGEKDFLTSVRQYTAGYSQNYGIAVDLEIGPGVDEAGLTLEAQIQLLRILQEAFSNARKHSRADRVAASLGLERKVLWMRVRDNGVGFDPNQAVGAGHFGLGFMRERAEELGGSWRVESAPGAGTCVEVTAPVAGTRD